MEVNYKIDNKTVYKYQMNNHMAINFVYIFLFSIGFFIIVKDLFFQNFIFLSLIYLLLIILLFIFLLVVNSIFTLISIKIKPVFCNHKLLITKIGIKIDDKLVKWNNFNKFIIKKNTVFLFNKECELLFTKNKDFNFSQIKELIIKYGKKEQS